MLEFRRPGEDEAATLTALAHTSKRMWNYPDAWLRLWKSSLTITAEHIQSWHVEVAELDARIVGYFAVSSSENSAELQHLWVVPKQAGRGFGKQLFQRALAYCRAGGIVALRVVSDPNAEGFYRKMGGVRIGDVPSVPTPRTLPVLEFQLTPVAGNNYSAP